MKIDIFIRLFNLLIKKQNYVHTPLITNFRGAIGNSNHGRKTIDNLRHLDGKVEDHSSKSSGFLN